MATGDYETGLPLMHRMWQKKFRESQVDGVVEPNWPYFMCGVTDMYIMAFATHGSYVGLPEWDWDLMDGGQLLRTMEAALPFEGRWQDPSNTMPDMFEASIHDTPMAAILVAMRGDLTNASHCADISVESLRHTLGAYKAHPEGSMLKSMMALTVSAETLDLARVLLEDCLGRTDDATEIAGLSGIDWFSAPAVADMQVVALEGVMIGRDGKTTGGEWMTVEFSEWACKLASLLLFKPPGLSDNQIEKSLPSPEELDGYVNNVPSKQPMCYRQFFWNLCLLAGRVCEKYGWTAKALAYADSAAAHRLYDPHTDQRVTNIVQAHILRGRLLATMGAIDLAAEAFGQALAMSERIGTHLLTAFALRDALTSKSLADKANIHAMERRLREAVKQLKGSEQELARIGLTARQIADATEQAVVAVPTVAASAAAYNATQPTPATTVVAPAPASTPTPTSALAAPVVGARTLTLLVESQFFADKKKCTATVASMDELQATLQKVLGVVEPLVVSYWDADFEEYAQVTSLDEFEKDKARVKVTKATTH